MKKALVTVALAAATIAAASAAALVFLSGRSYSDPASARCDAPPVTFGAERVLSDHREVDVHFRCAGAVLAGTLALPKDVGRHPAVVWVHGSGASGRLTYDGAPVVRALVRSGLAVLSYDKRGVGESQGVCCPGDSDHFNLLAADADGAVNALRSSSDVDPGRIGFVGASQAGWIVPLAVARSHGRVAFTALVDGPTVTTGEERLYSKLTGDEEGRGSGLSRVEIARRLVQAGSSGFDPEPLLERMTVPGLWLYGSADQSGPDRPQRGHPRQAPKGGRQGLHRRAVPGRAPRPAGRPSVGPEGAPDDGRVDPREGARGELLGQATDLESCSCRPAPILL